MPTSNDLSKLSGPDEFQAAVDEWLDAFDQITKTYIAVRADDKWCLRAAHILFSSPVDSISTASSWRIATDHVRAGRDVTAANRPVFETVLGAVRQDPFQFECPDGIFDLIGGGDRAQGHCQYCPVNHPRFPGGRRVPGLRITYSENMAPRFNDYGQLDAELKASDPMFRDIDELLSELDLPLDLLKLHILPHIDVTAPAPAIISTTFGPQRQIQVSATAAASLDPSRLVLNGMIKPMGNLPRKPVPKGVLAWKLEGACRVARCDFPDAERVSLALVYNGVALDSCDLSSQMDEEGKAPAAPDIFLKTARASAKVLGADRMLRDIARLERAVDEHPDDAVGCAKEIIESCCKSILTRFGADYGNTASFSKLVRMTLETLNLTPDHVSESEDAGKRLKSLLGALSSIANSVAELRNTHGTGHGRSAGFKGLEASHGRLAAMAAMTFVSFVVDCCDHYQPSPDS